MDWANGTQPIGGSQKRRLSAVLRIELFAWCNHNGVRWHAATHGGDDVSAVALAGPRPAGNNWRAAGQH